MKRILLFLFLSIFSNLTFAQGNHPVSWKLAAGKTAPSTFKVMVEAEIREPYHIYPQQSSGGGLGMPTEIIFEQNANIELVGEIEEKGTEEQGREVPAYYKKGVVFSQTVKLKSDTPTLLAIRIKYMACNDVMCLPPSDQQFTLLTGTGVIGKEAQTGSAAGHVSAEPTLVYEDFLMADTMGRSVSAADIRRKAKYTFIDFWASWCAPCREQGRALVPLYARYKAKGLQVLGVSLDANPAAWKKAIRADGYGWPNISDLKGFDSATIKKYGITAIPRNFIIDSNGQIVAKDLHGSELEAKLSEMFK